MNNLKRLVIPQAIPFQFKILPLPYENLLLFNKFYFLFYVMVPYNIILDNGNGNRSPKRRNF